MELIHSMLSKLPTDRPEASKVNDKLVSMIMEQKVAQSQSL